MKSTGYRNCVPPVPFSFARYDEGGITICARLRARGRPVVKTLWDSSKSAHPSFKRVDGDEIASRDRKSARGKVDLLMGRFNRRNTL